MSKQIVTDISRCMGCKSCEIACAVAHSTAKNLEEAVQESPLPQRRVTVEAVAEYAVPMQCQHCEDAPCIAVCPSTALRRDVAGGPVLMTAERCIGCKFCVLACPFGVIEPGADAKVMVKCDLCMERTAQGELPACVESCPTGAMQFEESGQVAGRRRRTAAGHLVQNARETQNGFIGEKAPAADLSLPGREKK